MLSSASWCSNEVFHNTENYILSYFLSHLELVMKWKNIAVVALGVLKLREAHLWANHVLNELDLRLCCIIEGGMEGRPGILVWLLWQWYLEQKWYTLTDVMNTNSPMLNIWGRIVYHVQAVHMLLGMQWSMMRRSRVYYYLSDSISRRPWWPFQLDSSFTPSSARFIALRVKQRIDGDSILLLIDAWTSLCNKFSVRLLASDD